MGALLRAAAEVNKANNRGSTPLYIASETGHRDVADVLLQAGGGGGHKGARHPRQP